MRILLLGLRTLQNVLHAHLELAVSALGLPHALLLEPTHAQHALLPSLRGLPPWQAVSLLWRPHEDLTGAQVSYQHRLRPVEVSRKNPRAESTE